MKYIIILLITILIFFAFKKRRRTTSILSKKKVVKEKKKIKVDSKLEERFCKAGMFLEDERKWYFNDLKKYPFIMGGIGLILGLSYSSQILKFVIPGIGIYYGTLYASMKLDKKIKQQEDNIVYYLPLVIEQLVIGISSGLDVGPCISEIVRSCKDRGTHNAVTLLLEKVEYFIKSGNSLEDSLIQVGRLSGHTELKQTFMQISQVSKHGGEIASQLKELADAVTNQQEIKIDGIIRKLELKATMPLTLAFAGNMGILLIAIFMHLITAFANQ